MFCQALEFSQSGSWHRASTDNVVRLFEGIIGKVSIAGSRLNVAMVEQSADDGKWNVSADSEAGEAMPQIMEPHIVEFRQFA